MRKIHLIFYLFLVPIEAITSVGFAVLLQPIIDIGISGELEKFVEYIIILLLVACLNGLSYYGEEWFGVMLKTDFLIKLREKYLKGIFSENIREFQKNDTAYHFSKMTVDSEIICEKYCYGAMQLYRTAWSFIVSVYAILFVNGSIAILVLVFAGLAAFMPKLFQKRAQKAEEEYLESNQQFISESQSILNCYLVIKVFHIFREVQNNFRNRCRAVGKKDIIRRNRSMFVSVVSMMVTQVSFIATIAICMLLVMNGKISVGYVMSVTELLGGVMAPFQVFPVYMVSYRTGKKLYKQYIKTFDGMVSSETNLNSSERENPRSLPQRLILKDVSFNYENMDTILDHVSLELDMCKKYAIVGKSGSGKTTLAKLIAGFLEPTDGSIEIDGVNISEMSESERYYKICYQGQQLAFFNDSIENNIMLGKKRDDKIWNKIIKLAKLEEVLAKFPEGKNTQIEENGKNISGGEAQRIGIARCLAQGVYFTVFDEITANLDPQNAKEIENVILQDSMRGALVITHHLNAENQGKYDEILEVRNGKIISIKDKC